tara:strand:- start:782 stop:1522 length:741 start_codon:yes stop_codon:yes gene_type:complete
MLKYHIPNFKKKQMNTIKKKCLLENIKLIDLNLCFQSFGNVSLKINKDSFVIKPSGINLNKVDYRDFPVININNGQVQNGKLKPSSDVNTHLLLYKKFQSISSIAHTHSKYATIWAQSKKEIPIFGSTHADYWNTPIPITHIMSKKEIELNYELNTGIKIVELMKNKKLNYMYCPGVLVANHGPFTWGVNHENAVKNAEILEYIAELAFHTINLNPKSSIKSEMVKKHFNRKHGKNSYYGQNKNIT